MMLRTGNNSKKRAFTLLELLLVIVIIAVLMGLAIPRISKTIANTSFKSFINKACLFLDYASTRSTLKNIILEVRFDLKQKNILLRKQQEKEEIISQLQIPQDISIDIGKETVIFYPDGTSEEFKIIISDNQGRKVEISSSGFDGKIKRDE